MKGQLLAETPVGSCFFTLWQDIRLHRCDFPYMLSFRLVLGDTMSKPEKLDKEQKTWNNFIIWNYTGLLAIILIILQDYISTGISDISILISVIAFSIAIPTLVGSIIHFKIEIEYGYYDSRPLDKIFFNYNIFRNIGLISAFIGIDATFWHLLWITGVIFLAVSLISFFIYFDFLIDPDEIERLRREESERERSLE